MAIDTAEKRFSMLGFGNPSITHLIPQGAIGRAGRSTLMSLYSGITLSEASNIRISESWDYITDNTAGLLIEPDTRTLDIRIG